MKIFQHCLLACATVFVLSACQTTTQSEDTAQSTPLAESWSMDSAHVRVEGKPYIVGQDTAISTFNIIYPFIRSQDTTATKINSLVELRVKELAWSWLGRDDAGDYQKQSLQWFGKEFVQMSEQDFAGMGTDAPVSAMSYEMELVGKVVYQSPVFLSIQFDSYAYTGGAHPNSSTDMLHVSLQTGKELRQEDWIADTTALKKVAQSYFFANEKKVDPSATPDLYFFGSEFTLPNSMAISDKGLRLIYSPYEAASYARGFIEFTIPFKDLKGILRKEVIGLK